MSRVLALLAILQLGDVLTTLTILKNGKELNPVMNWLFAKFGTKLALIVKAILVCAVGVMFYFVYPPALVFTCVLYVFVVSWNVYQIIKA
jgi:hypothetical protein